MRRRVFLAGLGGAGAGVGLGGFSHLFPLSSPSVGPDWSPGEEQIVPSTCTLCPSHCGIQGRVVDGRLVAIDGNPLHPISRGGVCPKGKAGLQMLYHPARLRGPLERTGEAGSTDFSSIPWDDALQRVVDKLSSLRTGGRPEAMAWLAGEIGGSLDEVVERFVRAFGSPHLLREGYRDGSDEVMELTLGLKAPPAFDLDRADMVLSFGAPLSEAWWCMPQAARARDLPPEQRRRWIQVDTRLSRTAIAADEWVPVRPGSYGLLALALAYVQLKEGLYDAEWVRDGVSGFEDRTDGEGRQVPGFRSLVLRHGRPEEVAQRIGLPVGRIVGLAKRLGRARRPIAVWDQVVTWRSGGLADALAIHALNVLAGSIQRPGGVFVQPALPIPSLDALAGKAVPAIDRKNELLDHDWADRVLQDSESPIEVLFLHHANPVGSAPDPEKVRRALERIPLVVSFSPFLDESARHADLVLPDHTYLERWQDGPAPPTVPYRVWGVVRPMVPPLHDTRATGDLVLELASRLGGDVSATCPWSSIEQLLEARGKALAAAKRGSFFVPRFRREELRELEARGWWIPHGQDPGAFWKSCRDSGGWFDPFHDDQGRAAAARFPDGRVALLGELARQSLGGGPDPETGFLPEAGTQPGQDDPYPLRLIPYRVMTLASGTVGLLPWLLENLGPLTEISWEPWVEIAPATGREMGVWDGQTVRVVSEHGEFRARLRWFHGAQPGVLNAPYGLHTQTGEWGLEKPANPLAAVGSRRDPLTGLPDWYSTRVRIERA